MSFDWPWMLLSLLLVPACGFVYWRLQRRHSDAASLRALGIVRAGSAGQVGWRRHLPPAIFILGLTILLLATARPQMELALPRLEGIVVLAFDVSASMAADDLEPSRMVATKEAARVFIDRRPRNIKIGVVAFSDGGLVVQPPTDDRTALSSTIDRLVPQRGTSLGQGILAALNAISNAQDADQKPFNGTRGYPTSTPVPRGAFEPAVIVLLTDGENTTAPDPLEAAQTAIEQGVRIYTVGIGSPAGTTLAIDGFNVFTQLDEEMLKEIALLTEGEYFRAQDADDFRAVYDNLDTKFVVRSEEMEITSILAGASMLVLLVGGALSLVWFGRIP